MTAATYAAGVGGRRKGVRRCGCCFLGAANWAHGRETAYVGIEEIDYRDAAEVGYLAVCVARELGIAA